MSINFHGKLSLIDFSKGETIYESSSVYTCEAERSSDKKTRKSKGATLNLLVLAAIIALCVTALVIFIGSPKICLEFLKTVHIVIEYLLSIT